MDIEFYEEDASLPSFFEIEKTKVWLLKLAEIHNKSIKTIAYIICSDEYLLEVNKTHLNHDYYTDIITFQYGDNQELSGDIFISMDRILDNAKEFKVTEQNEMLRVLSHGLLHLMGFNDKTEEESTIMRKKENEAISLYENLNS